MPKAKRKTTKEIPASTEQKIKEAARKLFTQKGFAATRTRDIADEAGINLALLNYYFRSKQKLFDLIMFENFRQFIQGISFSFLEEATPLDQKIGKIVTLYIDFLTQNPDLPLFILNELRNNPEQLAANIESEVGATRKNLFAQLKAASAAGVIGDIDPAHLFANLMGLTIFPFIARPIFQKAAGVDNEQFNELMQQRKELIPIWIKSMLAPKKPNELAKPAAPPK